MGWAEVISLLLVRVCLWGGGSGLCGPSRASNVALAAKY